MEKTYTVELTEEQVIMLRNACQYTKMLYEQEGRTDLSNDFFNLAFDFNCIVRGHASKAITIVANEQ